MDRTIPVQTNLHSCNKVEKIRKGYMETWKETKGTKKNHSRKVKRNHAIARTP